MFIDHEDHDYHIILISNIISRFRNLSQYLQLDDATIDKTMQRELDQFLYNNVSLSENKINNKKYIALKKNGNPTRTFV